MQGQWPRDRVGHHRKSEDRQGFAPTRARAGEPRPIAVQRLLRAAESCPGAPETLAQAAIPAAPSVPTAPLPELPEPEAVTTARPWLRHCRPECRHSGLGDRQSARRRDHIRAGTAWDRERSLQCLAEAVYYEARSESWDGQRAVAQVVLNRVRHPAYPGSVCGVVFKGRCARRRLPVHLHLRRLARFAALRPGLGARPRCRRRRPGRVGLRPGRPHQPLSYPPGPTLLGIPAGQVGRGRSHNFYRLQGAGATRRFSQRYAGASRCRGDHGRPPARHSHGPGPPWSAPSALPGYAAQAVTAPLPPADNLPSPASARICQFRRLARDAGRGS